MLTAVGVGLTVALLPATAVPATMSARNDRGYGRDYSWFNALPMQTASKAELMPQ